MAIAMRTFGSFRICAATYNDAKTRPHFFVINIKAEDVDVKGSGVAMRGHCHRTHVLALALEKVNLHRRIALNIIRITGTTPNRVVLGFMIATASLSMWISNTASTVVMLPIAMSVIGLLINDADGFTKNDQNFALSVMLGIAFSANAGGIATVIGTPPNSVLIGLLENEYNIEVSFLKWMTLGLPFSIILLIICYLVLVKWMFPNRELTLAASKEVIREELDKLGPTTGKEKMVLTIFGFTVFLWIFRTLINN